MLCSDSEGVQHTVKSGCWKSLNFFQYYYHPKFIFFFFQVWRCYNNFLGGKPVPANQNWRTILPWKWKVNTEYFVVCMVVWGIWGFLQRSSELLSLSVFRLLRSSWFIFWESSLRNLGFAKQSIFNIYMFMLLRVTYVICVETLELLHLSFCFCSFFVWVWWSQFEWYIWKILTLWFSNTLNDLLLTVLLAV